MIDIHAHVLPGLDDGAQTRDVALEMLRVAARSGTTDLVATPHANIDFRFDPELVRREIAELQQAAGPNVRIHRGCELHLFFDNIQGALANPRRYTINGNSYLLVEFPDVLIARNTTEVFRRLIEGGTIPVICHPERNYLLHSRTEQLRAWVELGCRVQVTAQSFLGRFGLDTRRFAERLMRSGLVHFVASDCHDPDDRSPRLDEAYAYVARKFGEDRARALFVANPGAVLCGQPLPPAPEPPPRRGWNRLFPRLSPKWGNG